MSGKRIFVVTERCIFGEPKKKAATHIPNHPTIYQGISSRKCVPSRPPYRELRRLPGTLLQERTSTGLTFPSFKQGGRLAVTLWALSNTRSGFPLWIFFHGLDPLVVVEKHGFLKKRKFFKKKHPEKKCTLQKCIFQQKRLYCTEPLRFPVRPWASVREIKVATTKYGYTWTLSAIRMLMGHEEITSNVSSRKDPAFTRLTKRKAGTTMKVTTHFHPCRQCVGSCFHKQRVRRVKDFQP